MSDRGADAPRSPDADSPARTSRRRRLALLAGLGAPILLGLIGLAGYSSAVTGMWWKSPYQLYTELYTPRHVYGFNNVVRGERRLGPKVDQKYDRWAQNLTLALVERDESGSLRPSLLVRNVIERLQANLQFSLGIVPLAMAAAVCLCCWKRLPVPLRLCALALLSLHAVHAPYWFVGIMHWHYVFETVPLWLLLFAWASFALCDGWRLQGMRGMPRWWGLLILAALATSHVGIEPFWKQSRLEAAVQEAAFSRLRYADFHRRIERHAAGRAVLVIVKHNPYDIHMDYVTNPPDLGGPVLKARDTGAAEVVERSLEAFPDRGVLYVDFENGRQEILRH